MNKKIISIVLILAIICTSFNVLAVTSEYEDTANKKEEAESQLNEVKTTKSKALQEVQVLQDSIDKSEKELNELNTKITNLTASIKEKTKEIEEKKNEYEKKEEILKQRMVVLYEAGQTSYLEVLLTSKSITDFISKYYIMTEIAQADSSVLKDIEKSRKEIEETKKKLEEEKKEVDEAKKEKTIKTNELKNAKNEKQAKIDSLSEEEKKIQDEIDEYQATLDRIAELERQAVAAEAAKKQSAGSTSASASGVTSATSIAGGSGNLTWPIPGYYTITSEYGYRIHPIYGVYKLHNGIDVGAPTGASFVAADDGVVILAEYYGGYGNCVVISHGNGLTTRYAHGTSILVSEGQTVTKGTPVLTVGSTGLSTGPHAHFEVSINGSTVNPLNYL